MASGASGRGGNSGSKGFDFGADDILCSYEDYGNQDENNGTRPDSSIGASSNKQEFHKSMIARTSVFPPSATYSPPEESSFNRDVIVTVERTIKRYTEDLMRFLEGISSRLSQLELYCYNLDKTIGEMRSDLVRNHDESESKLQSLEKHVEEVHRSVQILRDKQELADTQKELAKLQLAQKESSSVGNALQNEERATLPTPEEKKGESSSDIKGQQLAIVPHQVTPQPSLTAGPAEYQQPPMPPPSSMPSQTVAQTQAFYLPPQINNQPIPPQPSQGQYLPAQSQIQDLSRMPPPPNQSHFQDFSRIVPQQMQSQVNQGPQVQSLPLYQQQWPPQQQQPIQPPQQQQPIQPPQQPVIQPQIRSSSPSIYSSYVSNQPPAELSPNSMPMQVPYPVTGQPGSVGPEAFPYGYGATGRPIQPQPSTQNFKTGFVAPPGDGYVPSGLRPALHPGNAFMVFDNEGGRTHHPPPQPHFQQGAYPPTLNPQRMPSANMVVPQSTRSHPHGGLIEKLVTMGYRGDHIVAVIQRLEESGQPIDFNIVLDRLDGQTSGSSQRPAWSG